MARNQSPRLIQKRSSQLSYNPRRELLELSLSLVILSLFI
jgi:hypothetical protein